MSGNLEREPLRIHSTLPSTSTSRLLSKRISCSYMQSVDAIQPLHSIAKGSWSLSSFLKRTRHFKRVSGFFIMKMQILRFSFQQVNCSWLPSIHLRQVSSLDQICYEIFSKSITKPTFELASLPPTNAAAAQHILRVYLQIQGWYDKPKDPLNWGWRRTDLGVLPIINTKDPDPFQLLNANVQRSANFQRSVQGSAAAEK